MTNHLADELRGIAQDAVDTEAHPVIRERLDRLAEHIERVATEPPDVGTGLEPEQQIRAEALAAGARVLAVGDPRHQPTARELVSYADALAAYIRTGERPA